MSVLSLFRRGIYSLAIIVLGACATTTPQPQVIKVEAGSVTISERLTLNVVRAWNQFPNGPSSGRGDSVPTWTREGFSVDLLQFYIGIKEGQEIGGTASKGQTPLVLKKNMGPREVIGLFESLWTRSGSSFELERIQPMEVMGAAGFRFDYSLNRKGDDLRMRGVGYALLQNGELHLIHYRAPRLVFFERGQSEVHALATSARVSPPR
jgi:hypothetical protein